MAWLGLGALLLFLAADASLKPAWRPNAISLMALTGLLATLVGSFSVYAATAAAAIFAGALALAVASRWMFRPSGRIRFLLLALGAASCAFALFGPADGLF